MGNWISLPHSSDILINCNMVSSNLHSGLDIPFSPIRICITVTRATLSSCGAYKITTILWINHSVDFFSAKAYCFQRNIYYKVTGLAAPQKEQKYIMTYSKIIFWWSYIEFSIFFHKNCLLISSGATQDCANKTSNNLNKIWSNSFKEGGCHFWSSLFLCSLNRLKRGSHSTSPRDMGLLHHTLNRGSPRGLCVPWVRFQMASSKHPSYRGGIYSGILPSQAQAPSDWIWLIHWAIETSISHLSSST